MGANDELQPLFLLSDEPIDGDDPDDLGRDADARLIAELVLGTRGPFTVGVYGPWGTGKTSLLNRVRRLLEAPVSESDRTRKYPYVVTVFFNAWQHHGEALPLSHLTAAIHDALSLRLKEIQSVPALLKDKAVTWLKSAHTATRAAAYGFSGEVKAGPFGPVARFSAKDAIEQHRRLVDEQADPNSKVWKKHVADSATMASIRSLRASGKALDEASAGPEGRIPRVVVFVDDMDRCAPAEAYQMLQGIKLALAQPGFVFVLSLNPAALRPFIAKEMERTHATAEGTSEAIYLDKLVQLPYPLRLRDEQFNAFARTITDERLKAHVSPEEHAIIKSLYPSLRDSSDRNPRTLKRRINAVIVDSRLAPLALLDLLNADPAKARAEFMGLCLLEQTARHFGKPGLLDRLADMPDLCAELFRFGLRKLFRELTEVSRWRPKDRKGEVVPAEVPPAPSPRGGMLEFWGDVLAELNAIAAFDRLFKTDFGLSWLNNPTLRAAFSRFLAERPGTLELDEPPESATDEERAEADAMDALLEEVARSGAAQPVIEKPNLSRSDVAERKTSKGRISRSSGEAQELVVVERAIRESLGLDEGHDLTGDDLARVTGLDLRNEAIGDFAVGWLSSPGTGLKALTALNLSDTQVTDAGVKHLARPDSGLKALTSLDLSSTQVTDAGMDDLAGPDTGLKALTTLGLRRTRLTDLGVKYLTRATTGLKALTALDLGHTGVTNSALTRLARPDSGLKALTALDLEHTQVTDTGLNDLARLDTGLNSLYSLRLGYTRVTDAGVTYLAHADTGLKTLTYLSLNSTGVTDAGVKALARADTGLLQLNSLLLCGTKLTDAGVADLAHPDSGLRVLTWLDLSGTQVTDLGVKQLARPDTGLRALFSLDLRVTRVTDAGVTELARPHTGLKALTSLWLNGTAVSDAGLKQLASPDTGLKALVLLDLTGTKVTDAGVKELARPDTGLKALTWLNLGATAVTDAGMKELARPDSGLDSLQSLQIFHTKVSDAGLKALKDRFPTVRK